MGNYVKEFLYHRYLNTERGILFLMAVFLLFIVTGAALYYTNAYLSQLKIYNGLESIYVRATINILSSE